MPHEAWTAHGGSGGRGWSRLDPEVIEEKYYAPGVGKIYETLTAGGKGGTELIKFTPGWQR